MEIGLFVATVLAGGLGGIVVIYYARTEGAARSFFSRFKRSSRGGFLEVRQAGKRQDIEIKIEFDGHMTDLPLVPRILIVREGPDSSKLLNQTQEFQRLGNVYVATLNYPSSSGMQFKCFVDWVSDNEPVPTLMRMRGLLEQNGWQDIEPDGLHRGRFWFILPEFATKFTEDENKYLNNWLPAGPPPIREVL